MVWYQYGVALKKFGIYLEKTGRDAESEQWRGQAREAFRREQELAAIKEQSI